MKIGEIAKITGVSARSLRYYEKLGILIPARTSNNYRVYSQEHLDIIKKAQIFISAGISLHKVKYLIPCSFYEDRVPMCLELENILTSELEELDRKIESLKKSRRIIFDIVKNKLIVD